MNYLSDLGVLQNSAIMSVHGDCNHRVMNMLALSTNVTNFCDQAMSKIVLSFI
jgi:hypothetical protein